MAQKITTIVVYLFGMCSLGMGIWLLYMLFRLPAEKTIEHLPIAFQGAVGGGLSIVIGLALLLMGEVIVSEFFHAISK